MSRALLLAPSHGRDPTAIGSGCARNRRARDCRQGDPFGGVRVTLAALREAGVDFTTAWEVAFPTPRPHRERVVLRLALDATADAWRRAYRGQPPAPAETAAAFLFALPQDDAAEDRGGDVVGVRCVERVARSFVC